jgi:methanogen homocitrate synthase
VVLGKKSGKDSIIYKLNELGLKAPEDKVEQILEAVKTYSEQKKRVLTDHEFVEIVKKFT